VQPVPPRSSSDGSAERARAIRVSDVGRILVGGAPFALLVTAICVAAAVLVSRASDPVYEASVTLVAPRSAPAGESPLVAPAAIDPAVYRSAVFEGGVLAETAEALEGRPLGDDALQSYAGRVRIAIEERDLSSLLRIEARAGTPDQAADLANGVAQGLVDWDRERARQSVEGAVAALESAIAEVDARLAASGDTLSAEQRASLEALRAQRVQALTDARARAAAAVPVALISPLRAAQPPERPIGRRQVLNTAIAIVLGLALGYGLVVFRRVTRPMVADARDAAEAVDAPVLATFARRARGDALRADEAPSLLQARVVAARPPNGAMVVTVTSVRDVVEQEGVAIALAESLARSGLGTLLVDADLRAARSTALLEVGDAVSGAGREEAAGRAPAHVFGDHVTVVVDEARSFEFLPAPAMVNHPAERLARVLDAGLPAWSDAFDVIVLDAAPVAQRADALVAAARADHVVLCLAAGRDAKQDVVAAAESVRESGGAVLGAVLTRPGRGPLGARRTPARPRAAAPGRRAPAGRASR
jgi:Mrp family chromosome partitioning ATPase